MSRYHTCVWIDHREARVLSFARTTSDLETIKNEGPDGYTHIHRKADHLDMGKSSVGHEYLDDVSEALQQAKAILICGPGPARTELAGHLNAHHPAIAKRIWGIEPMDHPTDPELLAAARKFFHSADRMHA
jgi:hypothetical protein